MAFDSPPAGNTPPPTPGDAAPVAGYVSLGSQYLISTSDAVPALSGPTVEAFQAADRRHPGESLVALICSGEVVPRTSTMQALRSLSLSGAVTLVGFGPVDWTDNRQRMAAIYTSPLGGRFSLTTRFQPAQIIDIFLRPVAKALDEIHGRGTTHRAIRPDNLFLREAGTHKLSLGPCVATPPGFGQPDIYEPLDTAAADPSGRSAGGPKHDVFALGMTALALLLGRQPGAGIDRDELMIRRLELGSLAAVVERSLIPREFIDALHGMLADDESDRWTLSDLHKWMHAGRPDTAHPVEPSLAPVPYEIADKKVRSARSLAYIMGRRWNEGARHLRGGALQRWVHEYAPERIAAAMLDVAMNEFGPEGEGDDGEALMVSRAVMALDPQGPLRYRDLAVDPHGLGPFLFDASRDTARRATAIGMLKHSLPQRVLERRPSERRPNARRANRQAIDFERLRRWAMSDQPWEGLDRCLYDLNDNLPCLSQLIGGRWVATPADLLTALDAAALSGGLAEPTIDPPLATFLAARTATDPEALMALLRPNSTDDEGTQSAIRLFAELQQEVGGPPLRGITMWCGKLARRIAERIHHRPTRALLLEGIDRAVPHGSIAGVLRLVAIPELKPRDDFGFASAKATWSRHEFEIRAIQRNVEARRDRAWRRGRENVSVASGAGAFLIMLTTLFLDSGS